MDKETTPNGELAQELGRELIEETGSIETAYEALCITAIEQGLKIHYLSGSFCFGFDPVATQAVASHD